MKKKYTYLIDIIFLFFLYIIPKRKKIIIYSPFIFEGNAYAIFNYLMTKSIYKLIFITQNKNDLIYHKKLFLKKNKIFFCHFHSFKAFYHYASARYIFCTHPFYRFNKNPRTQKIILLWHGMPIKTIGYLKPENSEYYKFAKFKRIDYFISTSSYYDEIISKSFNIYINKILSFGQPCQDTIINPFPNEYLDNLKNQFKKIICYCPTFRSCEAIFSSSQTSLNFNDVFIKYFDGQFIDFLAKNQILLIIKLHPAELQHLSLFKHSNILYIKNEDMIKYKFDLYEILARSDIMINDISSSIIDFLITDKPYIFIMDDIDEYIDKFHTTINNYKENLPGRLVKTKKELLEELEDITNNIDNYKEKRNLYKIQWSGNYKGNSCEQIVNAIGIE